jgi:sporulation protein YlmC with PRC-barrel domain
MEYHLSPCEVLSLVKWRRREEVIGKDVIDADAKRIGVTKDIGWSDDGTFALLIESIDEEESFLAFGDVERIGDVIFVKAKASVQAVPMKTCPVCKHKNPVEAMFCAKCGRSLEGRDSKSQ